jgi:hypothetical protein
LHIWPPKNTTFYMAGRAPYMKGGEKKGGKEEKSEKNRKKREKGVSRRRGCVRKGPFG